MLQGIPFLFICYEKEILKKQLYHLVIVFIWPSWDGVGLALCQQSLLDSLQVRGKGHPGLHFTGEERQREKREKKHHKVELQT